MQQDRLKLIEDMLESNPDDSFLQYAVALEYHKLEQLDKAIECIESLLKQDKSYLGAYYKLGKIYEEKDQVDKAITVYKSGTIVAREQKDQKTLGELSEALMILGADEDESAW